jgi:hypothetical protein
LFFPKISIPLGYAEGEASYIINSLERTAPSVRFSGIPVCGGGPPLNLDVGASTKWRLFTERPDEE